MFSQPFLIGIAGPSCAGKSELTRSLSEALGASVFALDSYYRNFAHLPAEERARQNFDDPAALDDELICEHLQALARGEKVRKPLYDFAHHLRLAEVEIVNPSDIILVEGLFALYWETVRSLLDVKVYVTVEDEVCRGRRISRDVRERGRTRESICEQYDLTVRPMAKRYVYPTRAYADLVLRGDEPLDRTCAAVVSLLGSRRPGPRP